MIHYLHSQLCRTLRWVRRFRQRRGYGIHSPFAFGFVTGVVYESGTYYAYPQLARLYHDTRQEGKWRLKDYKLLFRLTNYQHPTRCMVIGFATDDLVHAFIKAGSRHTLYTHEVNTKADMIIAARDWVTHTESLLNALTEGGMMVLAQVGGENREAWHTVLQHPKAQVAFDLYDFGIVFYRPELNRQHYVVNYR